jgi:hypothetical protein
MQLQVGKYYIWKGKTVKLVSKWAQGVHFTYTFDDGTSVNGDAAQMVASGDLKISIEAPESPPLKPTGSALGVAKPAKMLPPKWNS